MSKIFETDESIVNLARDRFEDTGLAHYGVDLKDIEHIKLATGI